MRRVALTLILLSLTVPAIAANPDMHVATLPEKSSGFSDLADCRRALGDEARGSRFNRAAGNLTRCEMVDGEAMMVVYPKGTRPPRTRS